MCVVTCAVLWLVFDVGCALCVGDCLLIVVRCLLMVACWLFCCCVVCCLLCV